MKICEMTLSFTIQGKRGVENPKALCYHLGSIVWQVAAECAQKRKILIGELEKHLWSVGQPTQEVPWVIRVWLRVIAEGSGCEITMRDASNSILQSFIRTSADDLVLKEWEITTEKKPGFCLQIDGSWK